MLLLGNLFFGIVFTSFAIVGFVKAKKDIDELAKKFKSKGQDVTIDSEEEKNQIKKEVVGMLEKGLKDAMANTLTKYKFSWFAKNTIPIYCIIAIVVSLLLGILISVFLGIFVFIILVIVGLCYYFILFKKCKY